MVGLPPLDGTKKSEIAAYREANSPPKAKEGSERPPPSIAAPTSRKKSFIRLLFGQMDFSAPTAPDFATLHCFSKSKSICADASAESRAIHAIWTPQNGGKRGGCVLSRAKLLILFRIDAILRKKSFKTIEKRKHCSKTSGLSFELSLFFAQTTLLFGKSRYSAASFPLLSLSHVHRQARTDSAPTHIAHSASLHFLPSPFTFTHNTLIIKRNKGEDKHRFNTSPVKAMQALPSPLTLSAPIFYAHEVKR